MPVNSTVIPAVNASDSFAEWLVSSNLSFIRIGSIVALLNSLESDTMGGLELTDLLTTDKTSLLHAINNLHTEYSSGALVNSITGLLADLTTTNKSNLVAAVNELDADVGSLAALTTTNKTSLVAAVNELNTVISGVGNTAALLTTNKTTLVAAVNEIFVHVGSDPLSTTASTLTGAVNELFASIAANSAAIEVINTAAAEHLKLDGSNAMTGILDMGSKKIGNLAAGVVSSDAVNVGQVIALSGIGDLASLLTSVKTTAVDAINELVNVKVTKTSNTGSSVIPAGTTAQRDGAPANGYFRYNETTTGFEGFIDGAWASIGSTTFYTSATAPANPALGDLWHDTDDDVLYAYDTDGITLAWRIISSVPIDQQIRSFEHATDNAEPTVGEWAVPINGAKAIISNASDNTTTTFIRRGGAWVVEAIIPNSWTTVGRPVTPATGIEGYNTTLGGMEHWNGAAWINRNDNALSSIKLFTLWMGS